MSLLWILVIILLILAVFGAPAWPHARGYGLGWYPSAGLMLVVIILVIAATALTIWLWRTARRAWKKLGAWLEDKTWYPSAS